MFKTSESAPSDRRRENSSVEYSAGNKRPAVAYCLFFSASSVICWLITARKTVKVSGHGTRTGNTRNAKTANHDSLYRHLFYYYATVIQRHQCVHNF